MKPNKRVGFSGYSIYEMKELWRNIELFYFQELEYGGVVEHVRLYLKRDKAETDRLFCAIKVTFNGRWKNDPTIEDEILLDDRLFVYLVYTENYTVLTLAASKARELEPLDFDLVREVDAALRPLNLPIIPKPGKGCVFFRGEVLMIPNKRVGFTGKGKVLLLAI